MEKINSPAINSKDYMISFDVVSLFTKVPMKEVILILKIILEQDVLLFADIALWWLWLLKDQCYSIFFVEFPCSTFC